MYKKTCRLQFALSAKDKSFQSFKKKQLYLQKTVISIISKDSHFSKRQSGSTSCEPPPPCSPLTLHYTAARPPSPPLDQGADSILEAQPAPPKTVDSTTHQSRRHFSSCDSHFAPTLQRPTIAPLQYNLHDSPVTTLPSLPRTTRCLQSFSAAQVSLF